MKIIDIQKIQAQVRWIAKFGYVTFGWHCRNESMPDRNIDSFDVYKALKLGTVTHEPDPKTDMKFRVLGEDLYGKELTVIIIILDAESLFVKTVW